MATGRDESRRLAASSASSGETDDFRYNIVDKQVHAHDPRGWRRYFT
jgi:hypothetical protein